MNRVNRICSNMLMYIHAHYNESLTLSRIAANMYMNPAYLGRLFQQQMGMSFAKYLTTYRINAAQKMLVDRESTVSKVAHAVGYTNLNHFYKLFRQQTGRTPTQFRLSLQQYTPPANLFILPYELEESEPYSLSIPEGLACGGGAFLSLNNRLFYAYVQSEGKKTQVRLLSSLDDGVTWSGPNTLLETDNEGSPPGLAGFLVMRDGAVAVMLAENRSDGYWLVQFSSYDGLKTCRRICQDKCLFRDFFAECGCIVRLNSGRLVLPVSSCRTSRTTSKVISFFVSDDDGATWAMMSQTLSLSCRSAVNGLRYPTLLPEKKMVRVFAATDLGCQYEAVSQDDAQSWSLAQPTLISSPLAGLSVVEFASEQRAALFNPVPDYISRFENKSAARLILMTDTGDGRGWAYPLPVENLYPADTMAFSCLSLYCAGSTLYAAYLMHGRNRQTLRIRQFSQARLTDIS